MRRPYNFLSVDFAEKLPSATASPAVATAVAAALTVVAVLTEATATAITAAAAAVPIATIAKTAAVTGQAVKNSCNHGRGRGLPYNRGNGIAVSYDGSFARIVGYERSIDYLFHISSPLRRIQPSPTDPQQGRVNQCPSADCTRGKRRRLFLRCPQRKPCPREQGR